MEVTQSIEKPEEQRQRRTRGRRLDLNDRVERSVYLD
jgi:hypothetical protein